MAAGKGSDAGELAERHTTGFAEQVGLLAPEAAELFAPHALAVYLDGMT